MSGTEATNGKWSVRIARGPGAVRLARDFVTGVVARSGWRGPPEDAELACDELVANALVHTDSPVVTVRLWRRGDRLGLEVGDDDPRPPRAAETVDPSATSGRGMLLVGALARRWGVRRRGRGKTVWADLVADRARTPAPAGNPVPATV